MSKKPKLSWTIFDNFVRLGASGGCCTSSSSPATHYRKVKNLGSLLPYFSFKTKNHSMKSTLNMHWTTNKHTLVLLQVFWAPVFGWGQDPVLGYKRKVILRSYPKICNFFDRYIFQVQGCRGGKHVFTNKKSLVLILKGQHPELHLHVTGSLCGSGSEFSWSWIWLRILNFLF